MNRNLLQGYINEYKNDFARINNLEIYKWQAVKQFQDNWDPNAENFAEMLSLSLSKTNNLMAAGNYFPREIIQRITTRKPREIKDLFLELFDEENDVIERINMFRENIENINSQLFPGKKSFQDERAVLVYLNLKYPDRYFFYKYVMFKTFCERIEYDYKPRKGLSTNVVQFMNLCESVKEEIFLHNDLLKLHKDRLGENEYFDASGNILTQDFIYAVTSHLSITKDVLPAIKSNLHLKHLGLKVSQKKYHFSGKYIDHAAKHKRNKHIGDLGEQLVLEYEKEHCPSELADKVEHSAKSQGDGLGYDILSFDLTGNKKYIEVKATTGSANKAFYISGSELERSKLEGDNYFLYRLFNLNEKVMTADFLIYQGDLSELCINPTEYEVAFSA